MIVWLMNQWTLIKFRILYGYWCNHKVPWRSRLIDLGRRKMFWCPLCGYTEFV